MRAAVSNAVIAASHLARRRVVTVAVDGMRFRERVRVNDVLTFRAAVNAAWRTSMEVGVRVEAEDVLGGNPRHALTAYLTLVALNESATPTAVPPLVPTTDDEVRRWHQAQRRREMRLARTGGDRANGAPCTTTAPWPSDIPRVLAIHRALRRST